MHRHQAATYFVREVLGCQCPDEALRHINVSKETAIIAGLPIDFSINVGGRLLVYVVYSAATDHILEHLEAFFRAAPMIRDREGYNRLRLVVARREPDDVRHKLETSFAQISVPDNRLHLHVVAAQSIARLSD